jgi:hypothetical protein
MSKRKPINLTPEAKALLDAAPVQSNPPPDFDQSGPLRKSDVLSRTMVAAEPPVALATRIPQSLRMEVDDLLHVLSRGGGRATLQAFVIEALQRLLDEYRASRRAPGDSRQ